LFANTRAFFEIPCRSADAATEKVRLRLNRKLGQVLSRFNQPEGQM
jgi:hypothetical protein